MPVVFSPPANLTDFAAIPNQPEAWHAAMVAFTRETVRSVEAEVGAGNAQYYDPTVRAVGGPVAEQAVTWNGFPKVLYEAGTEQAAWEAAEQLQQRRLPGQNRTVRFRPHDEYLEWYAHRDDQGRITAVDLTCEGPEYWEALAHGYPAGLTPTPAWPRADGDLDAVVALYRRYVHPDVAVDDLLSGGRYDPYNDWNTTRGAMHLTHPVNTLRDQIGLAGAATVLRRQDGELVEDDDELIRCSGFGDARRASDPTIGGTVNTLARQGALITLRNPVGLYLEGLDTSGWTRPDGSPVGDYLRILRGTPELAVRARYEVPPAEGFVVGEISIGGDPIRWAGQIIERVTMKLVGQAAEVGQHRAEPVGCLPDQAGPAASVSGPPSARRPRQDVW